MANRPIVVAISGRVTPAIATVQLENREAGVGPPAAICAIVHTEHGQSSDRRGPIALVLVGTAAAAAQSTRNPEPTAVEPAAARCGGQRPHEQLTPALQVTHSYCPLAVESDARPRFGKTYGIMIA